ncbi:MAG: DnaJ domain-containing protein [Parcubacteria group bacterium]|nr:DnaJ domain-containing protein [Parcubacteria group bacterium]
MAKDYYSILGVPKNAAEEDIKKAYRKLAHEHHPDRGGTEAKFKEINEAYQILSDKNKRAQYDQFGRTFDGAGFDPSGGRNGQGFGFDFGGFGFRGFSSNGGINLNDVFEEIFETSFGQKDITMELQINFIEAALGGNFNIKTPNGNLTIEVPAGVESGQTIQVPGQGYAYKRRPGKGNLYLVIKVKTPKHLSKKAKELLEELKKEL